MHLKWPPNIKRGTTETECKSKRERETGRESEVENRTRAKGF